VVAESYGCIGTISRFTIGKFCITRRSTDGHNADMQHVALTKVECKKLFTDDGLFGAATKRPALIRYLKTLQPGDTAHGLETRPARPQLARPDNDAR
jgi:hypothetical protein